MPGLVDRYGNPISSNTFTNKKEAPPKTGPAFGAWAGRDITYGTLPGGGIVQFDLSKLTLEDFRTMRDHYQVNASLAVLSFMQHQSNWHIECDDKKVRDFVHEEIARNWTMLNRGMAQANWAGFSPNALEWIYDESSRRYRLDKVKDLIPEECVVHWKTVDGWHPPNQSAPKFKVYDGIKQFGQRWPIPVPNTLWYPLLMENGDYYGRKLLRPAFQSWFFSILLHLYANRYYERFGEPTPIGRAPYDEQIEVSGTTMMGADYMLSLLQQLRSRSVVVLPNDRTQDAQGRPQFDYDIDYLESQMRGADFERYMTRLDEEISIGLFTPILLLRTADVGSYNLGQGHERIYQLMLNAMNDDRKMYLDKYIINKLVDYNFGKNASRAEIVFRKMGSTNSDMIKEIMISLLNSNKIKFDIEELGQMAGMSITEIKQTIANPTPNDPNTANPDPAGPNPPDAPAGPAARVELDAHGLPHAAARRDTIPLATLERRIEDVADVVKEIHNRVRPQVEKAFKNGTFGPELRINMGFMRRLEQCAGVSVDGLYGRMDAWLADVVALGADEFAGPDDFMSMFGRVLNYEVGELL